ncbi:MAG: murein biosynthesis integral membrane protein MurJ [Actinobacteria bacterium]|nr:murein biosynthesis integral membrane protein MurJ [Actinomycetota bacterium]
MSRPSDEPAAPRSERQLLRSSGVVALGTGLSRLTGFVRVAVMAYAIGATALAEAYNLANNTPNLLYDLVLGGILSATLVPVIVEHMNRDDDEAINAVATVIFVVLLGATVVSILCAPLIIGLFNLTAPASQERSQAMVAVPLLMLFGPQILFYGLSSLGTALLNARRSFAVPAFAPVLNNLIVIALFLALPKVAGGHSPTFDQVADDNLLLAYIGIGTTLGIVAMTAVLWPAMRAAGIRLRWRFDPRHRAVRQIARLSVWTFGYVISNLLAYVVIQTLANGVDGVTEYAYAYIFFQLPYGLWTVSVMTAYTPEMAQAWARGELGELRDRFTSGFRLLPIVILPLAIGLAALAHPVISVILEHGSFDSDSADLTARTLIAFAVGLPAFSAYLYAMRGFYALRDTRTPFLINLGENIVNVVLGVALLDRFGVVGLAASFSVAYALASVLALVVLQRRVGRIFDGRTLRSLGTQLLAAAAMIAVVTSIDLLVRTTALVQMLLVGGAGLSVYVLVLMVLRSEESQLVLARLRRR